MKASPLQLACSLISASLVVTLLAACGRQMSTPNVWSITANAIVPTGKPDQTAQPPRAMAQGLAQTTRVLTVWAIPVIS